MRQGRFQKKEEDQSHLNEGIKASQVRVIDEAGEQLGVMDTKEALEVAYSRGLDLVVVSKNNDPPVGRIMNYGKHKYEQRKKQNEAKKKQKVILLKEIKMRPKTEQHDFDFKARHAHQFLTDGNKVKVTVNYRGREIAYRDLGLKLLEKFAEFVAEVGEIEKPASFEGRMATMILCPKK